MVNDSPPINVIEDLVCFCFTIFNLEILANPSYEMVLKNSFYDLVEEIRHQHFEDIGVRKIIGKWLSKILFLEAHE